jgi:histidinol-phosphate aminotransferase
MTNKCSRFYFPTSVIVFIPCIADSGIFRFGAFRSQKIFLSTLMITNSRAAESFSQTQTRPQEKVFSANEMLPLAEYLKSIEKVFIVDEAYVDFGAESLVPYINQFPNLLCIQTLSKSRSLAGLRLGFAIGNEDLIEALRRVKDSVNSYPVDRLAQAAAEAAMLDKNYFDETREKIIATRNKTEEALQYIGFEIIPSTANFIFIKHEKISGVKLFQALREKGILVRHFNKARIEQYLRVSIGTDEEMNAFVEMCKEIS